MAPCRPTDWEPLACVDPVPGDPDALERSAAGLRRRGHRLTGVADQVRAADTGPVWTGLAAVMYEEHRRELPGRLETMSGRHHAVASAVGRYAGALRAAQATADAALADAKDAERRRLRAEAGIDDILDHVAGQARLRRLLAAEGEDYRARPWEGPDWYGRQAAAETDLAAARRKLARAVGDRDQAARHCAATVEPLRLDPRMAATLGIGTGPLDRLVGLLDPQATRLDRTSLTFVMTPEGLVLNTKTGWMLEAYRLAGIDPAQWDPSRGLPHNDAAARKAWELYAWLFGQQPDKFLWAGMAKLAGGTFYAGFQDLYVLRRAVESDASREVIEQLLPPTIPWPLRGELAEKLTEYGAGELRFVETTFLKMQKDIFDDLAWQHVAYMYGGIRAIEALPVTDLTDREKAPWRQIDSGDPARAREGNRVLLKHEQFEIIQKDYDKIRKHSPLTHGLTVAMSYMGESPVPGGRPFREVVIGDLEVQQPRIPLGPFEVPVPGLPPVIVAPDVDANVSRFEDRWEWITEDMLPAYQRGLETDPEGMRRAIDTPIEWYGEHKRNIPDEGPFRYP